MLLVDFIFASKNICINLYYNDNIIFSSQGELKKEFIYLAKSYGLSEIQKVKLYGINADIILKTLVDKKKTLFQIYLNKKDIYYSDILKYIECKYPINASDKFLNNKSVAKLIYLQYKSLNIED